MSGAFTVRDEPRAAPRPMAAPPGAAHASSAASSAGGEGGGTAGSYEKVLASSASRSSVTGTNAQEDRYGTARAKGGERLALSDAAERVLLSRLLARKGAHGVASYWSQRAKAFGFGPVVLTRDESDLVLREQDQYWIMPSATRNEGNVVFVDGTRPFPYASDERRLRCLFFLAAAYGAFLANGEGNAEDDAVAVVLVTLPPQSADDAHVDQVGGNLEAFLTFLFLMATELDAVHFLVAPEDDGDEGNGGDASNLENFRRNLGPKVRYKSHFHFASSADDAAAALENHGLLRRGLPSRLGGTLQRQESSEWLLQQSRAVVEAGNAATFSGKVQDPSLGADEESLALDRSEIVPAAAAAAAAGASSSPARTNTSTNQNSQEFIRKRNAVYARRKYARRKIEVQVLNEQKDELEEQKRRLQAEGRRLEGLLRKARRDVIHLHSSSRSAAATEPGMASGSATLRTFRGGASRSLSEPNHKEAVRTSTADGHPIDIRPARNPRLEQVQHREKPSTDAGAVASWPDSGSALSRYLESLREGHGLHTSRRPVVPDPPPASSTSSSLATSTFASEEEVAARRRDVTLRLSMLNWQHQQWQVQQQLEVQLQHGNPRPGPSAQGRDPPDRRQEEGEGRSPFYPRGR